MCFLCYTVKGVFMNKDFLMRPIARIHSDFQEKFGIPRQSGLADTEATITFFPEYADPEAVRCLECFSHIWLIWCFSEHTDASWHATVRPPRLGGNRRVGVFASRSPFRPNPVGLSCVQLLSVEIVPETGPVLKVRGADLLDGTPIFDIKPYLPYADCIPEATGGFSDTNEDHLLKVQIPKEIADSLPPDMQREVIEILSQDPRPAYQDDPERIYGLQYADRNIRFKVSDHTVYVTDAGPAEKLT